MTEAERETYADGARVSVTIEATAKGPRWRIRTTDLADEETIDRVLAQAVAAYGRLEQRLAGRREPAPAFRGEEPAAP